VVGSDVNCGAAARRKDVSLREADSIRRIAGSVVEKTPPRALGEADCRKIGPRQIAGANDLLGKDGNQLIERVGTFGEVGYKSSVVRAHKR